ncbi:MAG TPA: hypothetical protein VK430_07085 [Xanthobacteraceae bacterium]|nr:hypothetical protein [Xanthobacteraceae bacterium]
MKKYAFLHQCIRQQDCWRYPSFEDRRLASAPLQNLGIGIEEFKCFLVRRGEGHELSARHIKIRSARNEWITLRAAGVTH